MRRIVEKILEEGGLPSELVYKVKDRFKVSI